MFAGENDTYYNFEEGLHPVAPEAWVCRDSYFTWSVEGVKYFPDGIPAGYE